MSATEGVPQFDVFSLLEGIIGSISSMPKSREASLAITKLQEAFFWLEEAVANLDEDVTHRATIHS